MLTWSTKHKLLYLGVFFVFIAFLVALPSFLIFYKAPTCFDGKQNQGEKGVDCSGPCSLLCASETLNPIILWQRSFKVVPGVYNAIAAIENPNFNSEVAVIPYIFRLYDADNTVIVERTGRTFIEPKKIFHIFESTILTGNRIPVRTTFDFGEPFVWRKAEPIELPVAVIDARLIDPMGVPKVTATLENRGLTPLSRLEAVIVLFDEEGNAFAASRTVVDSINKSSSVPLVFTWREPFTASTTAKLDFSIRALPAGF